MSRQKISKAISALIKGEIIVYPTDTIYGLGADIFNEEAVEKIFKIKKRPKDQPISIAVSSIDDLKKIAVLNDAALKIAEKFLPGKITLILKKKEIISDTLLSGTDSIGVRIPNNKTALEILKNFGPMTCTSANIHKQPTPTVISEINMLFKQSGIEVYLDEGPLENKPSTIIDLTSGQYKIIRYGDITKEMIRDAINNG